MPKPQYGNQHQRDRELAMRLFVEGTPCPFCHRPMRTWQSLDLDHVVPVVKGGSDGPKRLSHSSCNRRAGAVIGNRSPKRKGQGKRIPRRLPKW